MSVKKPTKKKSSKKPVKKPAKKPTKVAVSGGGGKQRKPPYA